jgi:hypothetical protein
MLNFKLIFLKIAFCYSMVPFSHKVYEMEILKFYYPLTNFQSDNNLG